jgi:hypothetical protein
MLRFDYFSHLDGPQSFRDASGRMILCKGGGVDNSAADAAAQREQDRQNRIASGTAAVNAIFGAGDENQSPTMVVIDPEATTVAMSSIQGNPALNFESQLASPGAAFSGIAKAPSEMTPEQKVAYYQNSLTEQSNEAAGKNGAFGRIVKYKQIDNPAYGAAGKRRGLYDKTREDARAYYARQLNEDREKAARDLRFHTARQGTMGSSQANDLDTDFQRRHDRGLIDVANRADSAATQFRTSDEQARLNIISKIVAGLDQGSATQNALSTLQTNAEAAQQAAQQGRMANVFADMLGGYNQYQYGQGMQDARNSQRGTNGNFFTSDQSVSGNITKG